MSRRRGQSLIEISAVMTVLIPVLFAIIDFGYICFAAALNDAVCASAAKAAASALPETLNPALHIVSSRSQLWQRAAAVIKAANLSLPVRIDDSPNVSEAVRSIPDSKHAGLVDGEVTVQTTTKIAPPFWVGALIPQGIILHATHSLPFTFCVHQGGV